MTLDRDRLIKLLNMTGSSHDSEALAAIRRSNELLRRNETTWTDLLALPVEPGAKPIRPKPETDDEDDSDLYNGVHEVYAPYRELQEVAAKKAELRTRIRSVPLILRLLFFPIWALAETYTQAAHADQSAVARIIGSIVALAIGAFAGGIWLLIVGGLAKQFGFRFLF